MKTTVLVHARILTMDDRMNEYPDGVLVFDESGILYAGPSLPERYRSLPALDMHGALVLPGFCNTHMHMPMIPFRSLGDDCPDRLRRFLMPLEDAAMDASLVKVSTEVAIAESLLAGITSGVDMYYFESEVARAAGSAGFRLWAGETLLDKAHCDAADEREMYRRVEETIRECESSPLLTPVMAPHAPYSLSLESLHKCHDFAVARNLKWTMHLAEMPFEMSAIREKYGCTPVELLDAEGLLDSRFLAVHTIHLTDSDRALLTSKGVTVCHCPGANLKSGKGTAPVAKLLDEGCLVTLGTDGPSSGNTLDLFTQMKLCAIAQKTMEGNRTVMPAKSVVRMATRNAGLALGSPIGQLKAGYEADVIAIGLDRPNMHPVHDPYSVIVYSASAADVQDVWVGGVRKVEHGTLGVYDLPALYSRFDRVSGPFREEAFRRQ